MLNLNVHELGYRLVVAHQPHVSYDPNHFPDLTTEEYLEGRDLLNLILPKFKVEDITPDKICDINSDPKEWILPDICDNADPRHTQRTIDDVARIIPEINLMFFNDAMIVKVTSNILELDNMPLKLALLFTLLSVMDATLYQRGLHKLVYVNGEFMIATIDHVHKSMFRKEFP